MLERHCLPCLPALTLQVPVKWIHNSNVLKSSLSPTNRAHGQRSSEAKESKAAEAVAAQQGQEQRKSKKPHTEDTEDFPGQESGRP